MKTADLIPLILHELSVCDKYGIELTKDIETKSNGQIIIKQPTLYTILKKLEKSKFITSYWTDSEIGGKRHYYKLTENGKAQVLTLPSYSKLLEEILTENGEETENIANLQEEILPTSEVFSNNNIETTTSFEINQQNCELIKEKTDKATEFAEHTAVSSFVETASPISLETSIIQETPKQNINHQMELELDVKNFTENEPIKYVEYQNFKNQANYIYSKKISKRLVLKNIYISLYLIIISILSSVIVKHTTYSAFFYVVLIASILYIIFAPVYRLLKYQDLKMKYLNTERKNNIKLRLIVCSIIMVITIALTIIINTALLKINFKNLFSVNNFGNIYYPILVMLGCFVDSLIEKYYVLKID